MACWAQALDGDLECPGDSVDTERCQEKAVLERGAPGSLDSVARYLTKYQRLLTHAMFPPTSPGACQSFFFFFLRGIFIYECFACMHVCMYTICMPAAHGG